MGKKTQQHGIVYKITCIPTGRVYIGQTKHILSTRWYHHQYTAYKAATTGEFNLTALRSDILTFGAINFDLEILEADVMDDFRRVELETKHILRLQEEGVPLYNKITYMAPQRPTAESLEKANAVRSKKMKEVRKN